MWKRRKKLKNREPDFAEYKHINGKVFLRRNGWTGFKEVGLKMRDGYIQVVEVKYL